MQRAVTLALGITAVDDVYTFWRAEVPLALLWPDRISSQRDFVSPDHLSGMHEFHGVFFLVNDDAVGMRKSVERRGECADNREPERVPEGTYVSQEKHP